MGVVYRAHDEVLNELVRGKTLSELIGATGLAAESVMNYGVQIAAALAHAHDSSRNRTGRSPRAHQYIYWQRNVRYLDGLATSVPDGAEVTIVPAISGG
jgi:molybdopterin converting factor small subunit